MLWNLVRWCDRWLLTTLKVLTGCTFAAVVFSVTLGIVFRYALQSPLPWVEEFSRLNFIWSTFMGACVATREKEHLKIRIFSEKLGPKGTAIHDILVSCLALVFLSVVLRYGPKVYAAMSFQNYAGMPLSQKWQVMPVLLSASLMVLYFLAILVGSARALVSGVEPE